MKKRSLIVISVVLIVTVVALVGVSLSQLWSDFDLRPKRAKLDEAPGLLLTDAPGGQNERDLRASLARSPHDAGALIKLGDWLMAQHRPREAVDLYKQATVSDPGNAVAWSALGESYVETIHSTKSQLPPEASDAFAHAIAIAPNDLRSRFYLALEKDFLGHHDEALTDWTTMLGMVPAGSQADRAIRAAITASMGRAVVILRHRLQAATEKQKALPAAPAGASPQP